MGAAFDAVVNMKTDAILSVILGCALFLPMLFAVIRDIRINRQRRKIIRETIKQRRKLHEGPVFKEDT